jgi:hypothetical protein
VYTPSTFVSCTSLRSMAPRVTTGAGTRAIAAVAVVTLTLCNCIPMSTGDLQSDAVSLNARVRHAKCSIHMHHHSYEQQLMNASGTYVHIELEHSCHSAINWWSEICMFVSFCMSCHVIA